VKTATTTTTITITPEAIELGRLADAYEAMRETELRFYQRLNRALAIDEQTGKPRFTHAVIADQCGIERPSLTDLARRRGMVLAAAVRKAEGRPGVESAA
jgi:hypothetical protein